MNEEIQIKISDFVKEHREKIIQFSKENSQEFINLKDKDYSNKKFKLSYPLLSTERDNYWKDKSYLIEDKEYRFCSEFGGSHFIGGITRTERDGQLFLAYLKEKNLLLEKYKNKDIVFIVGSNNTQKEFTTTNISGKSSTTNIKNIILYGSPGVGKTHNTNRLIRLIEDGESDSEIFKTIKDNELTESIDISDIKERVKFITFHQSFGYEDFIEGFRPNEEGNIELTKGIFREICRDAQQNLDDSQKEKSTISQEKLFEELFELFKEFIQDELDSNGKFTINDTAYIINIEEDAFRYQGDNWGNTQRMKYSDIELLYQLDISERKEIKTVEGISGLAKQHATYFSYFMKQFLEFKEKQNIQIDEVEKVELKNYYLVIDEINRGNISKIFGELITLIEEDKRDKLEVTLPYSKDPFKIPSNLYIIGTMNSTDKSIALIDIALRRRFTFLKMKPNVELVPIESQELFKNLNEYISKILGEDYQIGHSYFMGGHDLDFILEYKIKPLLEEYFYGDDKGLDEVLKLVKNYERS